MQVSRLPPPNRACKLSKHPALRGPAFLARRQRLLIVLHAVGEIIHLRREMILRLELDLLRLVLTEDAKLMFFSTSTLQQSAGDDIRYDARHWDIWTVEER